MPIRKVVGEAARPVKIWTEDVDDLSIEQLVNIANLPFIHKHVAAMPDVHLGKGATVGSVIATKGAIVPAAVGVDIGCGMNAVRTSLTANDLPDNLSGVRAAIEKRVPVGFDKHQHLDKPTETAAKAMSRDMALIAHHAPGLLDHVKDKDGWVRQLGTLGGGNHFIEICLDEEDYVWIMLHSGSRGIGNTIGRYYIERAKEEMEKWHISLPDTDLAYLPQDTKAFADYWFALDWAQNYALENRAQMMRLVKDAVAETIGDFTITDEGANCHHNYVARENHYGDNVYITRKGAIRARAGDIGIIPGSMGAKSFIVRGLGNHESFCSCSHGAGRRLSRKKAKEVYTVDDLKRQTAGIECRKDQGVVDEIPGAYKDIDTVMENQSDLVEVLHTLRQVVCVKG